MLLPAQKAGYCSTACRENDWPQPQKLCSVVQQKEDGKAQKAFEEGTIHFKEGFLSKAKDSFEKVLTLTKDLYKESPHRSKMLMFVYQKLTDILTEQKGPPKFCGDAPIMP